MKGFPNQIPDLGKLAQTLRCIVELLSDGENPKDDGVLGKALLRARVLTTGHTPIPIARYLREQAKKPLSGQSFRTSARGLRQLFRLLGLIDDGGPTLLVTPDGHQAASFAGQPLGAPQIAFWRHVMNNFAHEGSHPYQVLLRLVAKRPGIIRAKCALALEAKDDSPKELERIVRLSALSEDEIRKRIGETKPNWDNAKKVIPRFAEQLGDVVKIGQSYSLADAPGDAGAGGVGARPKPKEPTDAGAPHRPRTSRKVTPDTIGAAGLAERDEPPLPPNLDPAAAAAAQRARLDRLRRHNLLVRALASRLEAAGMTLFEDPFDVLGVLGRVGVLGEVKTLDGTVEDERERVRDALAQLLYYEAFVTAPVARGAAIHKVACFETKISTDHQAWLNRSGIATVWMTKSGRFEGDALASGVLGGYLEELR